MQVWGCRGEGLLVQPDLQALPPMPVPYSYPQPRPTPPECVPQGTALRPDKAAQRVQPNARIPNPPHNPPCGRRSAAPHLTLSCCGLYIAATAPPAQPAPFPGSLPLTCPTFRTSNPTMPHTTPTTPAPCHTLRQALHCTQCVR